STSLSAQDRIPTPYFITYDHHLEEVDALELAANAVVGKDDEINTFVGNWNEFEYGVRKWWTTEFYLDTQHTRHEGSLYTGFRFENRFKALSGTHRINPVLYIEYEHLNGADKTLKEILGFDGIEDLKEPNSETREEKEREFEGRIILSSDIGSWNVAGNFIGAKNIHGEQWEFGYTVAASRPLASKTGRQCAFCAEQFSAGVEVYGGLGIWDKFTFRGTSQYIAPCILWALPSETAIRVSPGWGINDNSVGFIFRIGVQQEIDNVGRHIGKLFGH
ncbi:MAG TPA: hypothetical protein VFY29_17095, partial [Terriglobia bacterium]|nr:hypothetical protein [Terriglobia bacterium]